MPKLKIINDNVTIELPEGAKLSDYLKENTAFLFGCENAECATCMCTVVSGMENLNVKNHKEWVLLQKKYATPGQRLGCQLYIKKGDVTIEY